MALAKNQTTATEAPETTESPDTTKALETEAPPVPVPTLSPREIMTGTWRYIIPEDKQPTGSFMYMGYRLVYDITISENNDVTVSEMHFKRTDTESAETVEYFEGKRYILMYQSITSNAGSFKGKIAISPENENLAILDINGYEIALGTYFIEEKHYFMLVNDKLIWTKGDLNSKDFKEQYFPWDASTEFTKK